VDSKLSSHFGKSKGFIVINSDGTDCEYIDSQRARQSNECAPIRSLVESGCRALICQSMGRGALATSHAAGFLIYKATSGGTVAEVLEDFRQGNCLDFPDSALCSHHDDHDHDHECGAGHTHSH
jgi:predicted Fe-Mo cluster-binding NifX family protein